MKTVTFPLKQRDKGIEVANLQDALKLMLEREAIFPGNPRARAALLAKLPSERQTRTYDTTTFKLVRAIQEERQLRPDGVVGKQTADAVNLLLKEWGVLDEPTEPEDQKYQVKGCIYQASRIQKANVIPLSGALIRVFDRDLRHEQFIGETFSNRQGQYTLSYTQVQFRRAEKENADLIVRVLGPDGNVLSSSSVIFNAQPIEVIDIEVPGPPEYEQLTAELIPLLEGLPFSELTEEDVAFLIGETGIERLLISSLISAAKLASLTNLAINIHYGMLREGLPSELSLLLQQGRVVQHHALEAAIKNKRIASFSSAELNEMLDRIHY